MQDKRERMPDERLGKFMAAVSIALMLSLLFLPHLLDAGTRATCLAFAISGVIYGRGQVAAAKRWREKYGDPTSEELMTIKKSHSVNIFRLLGLIVVVVAAFVLVFVAIAYLLSRFNAR
jgi:cobalamin synthase